MGFVEREIELGKVYKFPKNLKKVYYQGKIIIISVDTANWLVFDDENEWMIFDMLNNQKSINEVYEATSLKSNQMVETFIKVVTQIEAKCFENKNISRDDSVNMFVYLTNSCNLRCPHCYVYAGEKDEKELNLDEWKKIIGDFKKRGGDNITFSGGEVTMREDLIDILKFTKELNIKTTVLTNGTIWSEELIIKASKYIDEIQISIDGYDEKSNAKIRGKGNFQKAIDTVDRFYELGVKLSIAVTPLYEDIDNFIIRFEDFAKSMIKKYNDNIYMKLNLELIKGRDVDLTEEENEIYKNKLKELTEKIYPNYYINNFILNHSDNYIIDNCGYGEITIAANGDVYCCNRIYEIDPVGNILEIGIEKAFEKLKEIKKKTSVDNLLPCKNCELKYICGGGCRIKYCSPFKKEQFCNKQGYRRDCTEEYKNSFYKNMIESNEFMYSY
ncbi:radical SAM/SPASM domain-containing protein [Crassaminicella indica]|uniref:Radical SAM protein n=1 Tax=Crassaminicella indica TaxID=2855394 RepID=A0ABX8R9F0_9CLOT|nr:radical SAM protein [Crassaminicella indica]QXM05426.1 radical SAM protein [Crassaminicella indica]